MSLRFDITASCSSCGNALVSGRHRNEGSSARQQPDDGHKHVSFDMRTVDRNTHVSGVGVYTKTST